jgi:hypothetical protein
VLKNSSMLPSWLRSKPQRPAIAVFKSCFESVCVPLWSMDRSDKDFFNRLTHSTHSGEWAIIGRMGWEGFLQTERRDLARRREGHLRRALGFPLAGETAEQLDRI